MKLGLKLGLNLIYSQREHSTCDKVCHVSYRFPPIYPCRPIHPFCEPEESNPLKDIPYFIDDLRRKLFFIDDQKELKQKKRSIIKVFELRGYFYIRLF